MMGSMDDGKEKGERRMTMMIAVLTLLKTTTIELYHILQHKTTPTNEYRTCGTVVTQHRSSSPSTLPRCRIWYDRICALLIASCVDRYLCFRSYRYNLSLLLLFCCCLSRTHLYPFQSMSFRFMSTHNRFRFVSFRFDFVSSSSSLFAFVDDRNRKRRRCGRRRR
jgi:hypothetical protein